nr:PREDICTED: transcription factor HES-5-like [Paralichthys olivaceus]
MAPTVFGQASYSKEHLTPAHKLRKPMVEKLRRDRINTCIEQLKSLLGPEFLRQQPDSKQEKADILEMAVAYMRSWQQQKQRQQQGSLTPGLTTASDGYSRCVQEAVSFLSHCEVQTQAHRRLLGHFQGLQVSSRSSHSPSSLSPPGSPNHQVSSGKGVSQASCGLWRPW